MSDAAFDPETIRIYEEVERKSFRYYEVCKAQEFTAMVCPDPRIWARNRIYFCAMEEDAWIRTMHAADFFLKGNQGRNLIIVFLSYPKEMGRAEKQLDFGNVRDRLAFVNAGEIRPTMAEIEAFVHEMACFTYCDENDIPGKEEYLPAAYACFAPWAQRLLEGEVTLYDPGHPAGQKTTLRDYYARLLREALETYPLSPETMEDIPDALFQDRSVRQWVADGFAEDEEQLRERVDAGLPSQLFPFVWHNDEGWYDERYRDEKIVRIKKALDDHIREKLETGGRAECKEVFEYLKQPPWGLLSNIIGVYLFGMMMRTWSGQGLYWCNGIHTEALDDAHMVPMLANAVQDARSLNRNRQPEYILKGSGAPETFFSRSEYIFDLPRAEPRVLSGIRKQLRGKLGGMTDPLWILRYADTDESVREAVGLYLAFVRAFSSDENGDAPAERLNALFTEDESLAGRLREALRAKMAEGRKRFLAENGLEEERYLERARNYTEFKWIWKEETLIEEVRGAR